MTFQQLTLLVHQVKFRMVMRVSFTLWFSTDIVKDTRSFFSIIRKSSDGAIGPESSTAITLSILTFHVSTTNCVNSGHYIKLIVIFIINFNSELKASPIPLAIRLTSSSIITFAFHHRSNISS